MLLFVLIQKVLDVHYLHVPKTHFIKEYIIMDHKFSFPFFKALEFATQGLIVSPVTGAYSDRMVITPDPSNLKLKQGNTKRYRADHDDKPKSPSAHQQMFFITKDSIATYAPEPDVITGSRWMLSDIANRCVGFSFSELGIKLEFKMMESREHLNGNFPFWMLYDQEMIGTLDRGIFIGDTRERNIINYEIIHHLSAEIDDRLNADTTIRLESVNKDAFRSNLVNLFVPPHETSVMFLEKLERYLNSNRAWNIFIDTNSLKGKVFADNVDVLESVKNLLMFYERPDSVINWVCLDLPQELTQFVK